MRKNIFLLSFLVMILIQSTAQVNKYRLQLKHGDIVPEQGVMDLTSTQYVEGYSYKIVQFYQIPDQNAKKIMTESGLQFLDYIPNYAYIVAIPKSFNISKFDHFKVRSIVEIEGEMKLHYLLAEDVYPDYALRGGDNIELRINYYGNINKKWVLDELRKNQCEVLYSSELAPLVRLVTSTKNVKSLSELPFVQFIEPADPPAEPENYTGRTAHRDNVIDVEYNGGRKYNGQGVDVMLQDDGVIGPHVDYHGRIMDQFLTSNSGDHGDHVAGTIMGAGNINPKHKGMAPGADIWVYPAAPSYPGFDSLSNSNHYSKHGIRISSTSYSNGCNAGYTSLAQELDIQTRTYPALLHVFSAGNSNGSNCGYGAGSQWGNITGGHKVGKNVIAVANLTYQDQISSSSSRGPAHDGRIKPDVGGKGTSVVSTTDPNSYTTKSGTSMSCPGVSGTMAQLYHAYRLLHNDDPPSGLMKNIIMNSADDLGNAGPDFIYGYGRINSYKAVKIIEGGNFIIDTISQNQINSHVINIPAGTAEARVMIHWTDYQGSVNASKALVNDLNMTVDLGPLQVLYPWVLDHTPNTTALSSPATQAIDSINNTEQVTFFNSSASTLTVYVNGHAVPQGPQKYYITYLFIPDEVDLTYPIGGESFTVGETEYIRWDATPGTQPFTISASYNGGLNWTGLASNVPASDRIYPYTVPTTPNGKVLIRVSRGSQVDISDTTFSIMNQALTPTLWFACPDSIGIQWLPTTNATLYQVHMLGNKYMDSVGITPLTQFVLPNSGAYQSTWYAVSAYGANDAHGKRSIAGTNALGLFNCSLPNDLSVEKILTPSGLNQSCSVGSNTQVEVRVKNIGQNDVYGFPLHFSFDNGTTVSQSFNDTIVSGDSLDVVFSSTVSMTVVKSYPISVWTTYSPDNNEINDSLAEVVQLVNGALVNMPVNESFDSFNNCPTTSNCSGTNCNMGNDWINVPNGGGDDIDWRTNNGSTPSNGTGPSSDHTGNGKYLYLEASNGCSFQEAQLISPCIDMTNLFSAELQFWYHMYGSDMGELHVDIQSGGIWYEDIMSPISGDQGNSWQQVIVNLSPYTGNIVNIRFRGITGSSYASDVSIDDIVIQSAQSPVAGFSNTANNCVNTNMTFTDLSFGPNLSYSWDFGAGATPSTANTAGPHTVTYSTTGNKIVNLQVTNSNGTSNYFDSFDLFEQPLSKFGINQTPNLVVMFSDSSLYADSWHWDFGDGNTSNLVNPIHTYTALNVYDVSLAVTNQCTTDTLVKQLDVNQVGIEEMYKNNGVFVYPNPTQDYFILEIDRPHNQQLNLMIYAESGELVREIKLESDGIRFKQRIELNELASGIYMLKIEGLSDSQVMNIIVE